MAFKVTIKGKAALLRRLKKLEKPIDSRTAKQMGNAAIRQMKKRIAKGKSPISGDPDFKAYRGGYRKAILDGRFPGKSLRPVNLKKDGRFLKNLLTEIEKGSDGNWIAKVGFQDKYAEIEQGHREGANGQAQRPIIPVSGEKFTRDVLNEVARVIQKRLDKLT